MALACAALLLTLGVGVVMAWVAGFEETRRALEHFTPRWLALLVVGQLAAYASYTVAHRWAMTFAGRPDLPAGTTLRMAAFGAAATSLRGGFSIDRRALRGAGASRRRANVRVLGLGVLEYAVLAPAACACALALLDSPQVQRAVSLPWAIGVPLGSLVALLWARWQLARARPPARSALRRLLGDVLGALEVIGGLLRHPLRQRSAWISMALHWGAELISLWAALRLFGVNAALDVVLLGYATGYALTPRSMPLAGAGISEALLPLSLMWVGLPLAGAVVSVLTYRILRLLLSMPPALVARPRVAQLLRRARARARA